MISKFALFQIRKPASRASEEPTRKFNGAAPTFSIIKLNRFGNATITMVYIYNKIHKTIIIIDQLYVICLYII